MRATVHAADDGDTCRKKGLPGEEKETGEIQPELPMLQFQAELLNMMMVFLLICRLQGRR